MTVRNRIKEIRCKQGLSLSELARASGLGRSTINEFEQGKHLPRIDAALMIAGALGVTVDELFWIEERSTKDGLER